MKEKGLLVCTNFVPSCHHQLSSGGKPWVAMEILH